MFQLGKTIVSEDIIAKDFVCNLNACKGACCIEGEAGAPVTEEEVTILKEIYPKVKPFLRPEGIAAIEKQGTHIKTDLDELETPLVDGRECAYVTFTDKGIASCGIEDAFNAGSIDFRKPISCHLYPVRVQDYSEFAAVNYHRWPICDDACTLGKELQVPVYKFVKAALIRKFGENWYSELEKVASQM
ncbi:DUF3109 family protein [Aequorivita vladivostokensis]|uniref:DUF3109 family protein n=1 Tax=Aequorivita vladivostokensis TaxID=171194 RepID=A0ABR5DLL3_9FLAO|nr:DUF3109 family protein [Aequorivita vladivostokensis]MAB56449.1 DUF3109 domain-containing protein [Aequorivita sp.]KJJ39661.1 hypothetical protein MB09_00280 [Aequorivita vladivostokensis]MBF32075.1 DUF3109 domain-containing protein [Aequorivita sp.]MDX1782761.1 DUF3109 family protein [Aequorivita vladivostokensis]HAV54739.1 DUF3109 domain-containing protein [Aequorivita sp.]|tara:strand:+ start:72687 stop:73250 length:564 start_codon:yes stop_codon:yes gene_type:complete